MFYAGLSADINAAMVVYKQTSCRTERVIAALNKEGRLLRRGSPRGGRWEVKDIEGEV